MASEISGTATSLHTTDESAALTVLTPTSSPPIFPLDACPPIYRLPTEVVERIFCKTTSVHERIVPETFWVLTHICRFWRNIATGHKFWTRIWVRLPVLAKLRDAPALLSLVLSRTMNKHLYITFNAGDDAPCDDLARTLLEMLVERCPQWRLVHFRNLNTGCLRCLTSVQGRLPRLKTLTIAPRFAVDDVGEAITAFTPAPRLVSLKSWEVAVDFVPLLRRLTTLKINNDTCPSSLLKILQQAPHLKDLVILATQPSSPVTGNRFTSKTLQKLVIASAFSDLALLNLPSLTDIECEPRHELGIILPHLFDLIRYSRCPLVMLSLTNCDLSVGSLPGILEFLPSLTKLMFTFRLTATDENFIAITDAGLTSLMTAMEKDDFIPELRILDIMFCRKNTRWSDFTFFLPPSTMAMFRRQSEGALQVLQIAFGDNHVHERYWGLSGLEEMIVQRQMKMRFGVYW